MVVGADAGSGVHVGQPTVELVSSVDRVAMGVIYHDETSATCGYAADGDAMFNDVFRPASALLTPTRELTITTRAGGSIAVGIQPLEPGMRLAVLATTRDLPPAADGTYLIALPGAGCFVITVGWNDDHRTGYFTGLAEPARATATTGERGIGGVR